MRVNDYQDAAKRTAIYPRSHAVTYPALGLVGELGEFTEKRDLHGTAGHQDMTLEDVQAEAGDCLWYLANLATDIYRPLAQVLGGDNADSFDSIPVDAAGNPIVALGQIGEAAKKNVRDGSLNLKLLLDGMVKVFAYLRQVADVYGISLDGAAEMNVAKLSSRQERGVLNGSGDKR